MKELFESKLCVWCEKGPRAGVSKHRRGCLVLAKAAGRNKPVEWHIRAGLPMCTAYKRRSRSGKPDVEMQGSLFNQPPEVQVEPPAEEEDEFSLRDYQEGVVGDAMSVIRKYGFVYLAMQMRTGKTITSLEVCRRLNCLFVLFVTKKKAIPSILRDYDTIGADYKLEVINYESLHKLDDLPWDAIILDESHTLGAFPKPSKRAIQAGQIIKRYSPKVIYLSGTPTPESYSQMYHQVYSLPDGPFSMYRNFYRFADEHVDRKQRKINGFMINDYSKGRQSIMDVMSPYMINVSQRDAGFKAVTNESVLYVQMSDLTYRIADKLSRDLVVEGSDEVILGDTAVKLMSKLHQIYSGTVKFESGKSKVIDTSKAEYIKERFDGRKIAIFYKFTEELNALKSVFDDLLTQDVEEFSSSGKNIALQIVSGREGISLKEAEAIVYYNIDFSATSYWQSRDRMTTIDRASNSIYWIFALNGIEPKIYEAVLKKRDYTVNHFRRDYEIPLLRIT